MRLIRLLSMCPYLEASGDPRQSTLITFREDIDLHIRKSSKRDYDSEGLDLCNTAELIRKDIFLHETSNWESLSAECQESSVPNSLKAFMRMIVRGPQVYDRNGSTDDDEQVILTIAQLLSFHSTVRDRKSSATSTRRHDRQRETPVPVYVALKLYGETPKKGSTKMHHSAYARSKNPVYG